MKKTILVIGGGGYIGSHVCKKLAYHGYEPVTYDSLQTGHLSSVQWGPFIQGNILNKPLLISTIKQTLPEAIFHLAAYSNARCSLEETSSYFQNNVIGTQTILEAMQESFPCPFIFSSSAAVYGKGSCDPLTEQEHCNPLSYYGQTKLACESLIKNFSQTLQIPYAILRYFNVAGADPEGQIGEDHNPETHLIPFLIQVIKGEKNHFSLFNKNHPTHDGTAKRDFVHVWDIAQAHIDALQWLQTHKKNITLNLGSGKGYTILDIVSHLEAITHTHITIKQEKPVEEPTSLIASTVQAKQILQWTPCHSDLTNIINSALNWHLKQ